ncbi:unnamed protein product [Pocillopora meandrina]|uniref:Uncharacterized protein n=1 Tax=Pocillopora meandrina TaxID=46732 RepID=A0AAU9W7L3_9CNID|nr:unnamed protein product [Pocillopora meandrina]
MSSKFHCPLVKLKNLIRWNRLICSAIWFSRLAIKRKNNLKPSAVSRPTIKWCRALFATDFGFLRTRKSSLKAPTAFRNRKCQRRRKRKWKTYFDLSKCQTKPCIAGHGAHC